MLKKNDDNKSLPHTVQGMKIFKICHVVKGETTNYARSSFTRELSSHSDLHKHGLALSDKYECRLAQTTSHIVNEWPLHLADADTVNRLE